MGTKPKTITTLLRVLNVAFRVNSKTRRGKQSFWTRKTNYRRAIIVRSLVFFFFVSRPTKRVYAQRVIIRLCIRPCFVTRWRRWTRNYERTDDASMSRITWWDTDGSGSNKQHGNPIEWYPPVHSLECHFAPVTIAIRVFADRSSAESPRRSRNYVHGPRTSNFCFDDNGQKKVFSKSFGCWSRETRKRPSRIRVLRLAKNAPRFNLGDSSTFLHPTHR